MTVTQNHHVLPPPLCAAVFDASIKSVPTSLISHELARDLLRWCHWLVKLLGIEHGKITVTRHQDFATIVKLSFSKTFKAESQSDFDPAQARRELDEAVQILIQSKGCLHPLQAMWCIHTIFSMLLRLSDHPYGKLGVTVRNSAVHEVKPTHAVRADKPGAEDQVSRRVYPRR